MTSQQIFRPLILALLAMALPLAAQSPPPYSNVWIDDTARLTEQQLEAALKPLGASAPENIVVLVHGFATPREEGAAEYEKLVPRVQEQFAKNGSEAAVVGIQWHSATGGNLFGILSDYWDKVRLARQVGHNGVRQILFALKEQYPQSKITVLGHSMGCEVLGAALQPTWTDHDKEGNAVDVFRHDDPLSVNAIVLLGSDLDYDVAYRGGVPRNHGSADLLWLTMSRLVENRYHRDRVLDIRSLIRGKASGSTFPRMTKEQYTSFINGRKIVFDNQDIPPTHHFLRYASTDRLSRIVPAILYKTKPGQPKPEIMQSVDEVMDGPQEVEALTAWFDQPYLTPHVYALWCLEQKVCSPGDHFADETLLKVGKHLRLTPRAVTKLRKDSPCRVVQDGYWPSAYNLERHGAPDWAPRGTQSDKRYFRGEISDLSDQTLVFTTDHYRDTLTYSFLPGEVAVTPSLAAVRVGAKAEIVVDDEDRVLEVRVLPYGDWSSKTSGR